MRWTPAGNRRRGRQKSVEKVRRARDEGSRVELGPGRQAGGGQKTMALLSVGRMCEHARRGLRRPKLGRIHTGSGSVPDSSEPYASGRLRVGFAFTLQTTDPPRTVRAHFAVYTLRLLRDRL